jgi:hypothetical protein
MSPTSTPGSTWPVSFERRLGTSPTERGSATNTTCPDVFLLSNGDIAIIGTEAPEELLHQLPSDAGIASHEKLIILPREVLLAARPDIMGL